MNRVASPLGACSWQIDATCSVRAQIVRLGLPACRWRRDGNMRRFPAACVVVCAGQGFGKPSESAKPPRRVTPSAKRTAPPPATRLTPPVASPEQTTASSETERHRPATIDQLQGVEGLPVQTLPLAPEELLYITVPPHPIEGVCEDCSQFELDELVASDAVYNHELSWTTFNWRVLALALDTSVPLLERLRFLAITARNLDEFFAKRVGGLKRQEAAGVTNLLGKRRAYRWTPTRQLQLVAECVGTFVERQTDSLMDDVLPALRDAGVHLYNYYELEPEERAELRTWFLKEVEPLLTPLAVDPGHPFPYLTSLALNLAIVLSDPEDPEQENAAQRLAIVSLPIKMQRWVSLSENRFVPLEHVVIYNLDRLFGGMEIEAVHVFRATRNADVERNEEEAEDLLEMMTDEVRERRFAPFVRLEANESMDTDMLAILMREMKLVQDDVYFTKGPLGIGDLFDLPVEFGMDSTHSFPHWAPMTHMRLANLKSKTSIFSQIRRGDILVHHPYQSFATSTQALIEAAAVDPKVVAIKCTLYRTSNNSPIINALIAASERGVQVAVLVELKARFDEARNVSFANKLEDAGCNVAYGLVGLKTHCKTTLVIRQEGKNELRPYCHIGTGNYNPSTAGVYTDYGLLTCDPELGADVMDLFKYLTGYHRQQSFRKLLVAPTTMRIKYLALIDNEIRNAKAGRPAAVTCKVNGIDDEVITAKLYEASQAGVKVDLIVRGICRVRPGVRGYSDNIRVVSIVGQFLEHHRVVRYHNNGEPLYFIGSADWMTRNLMRRVEVATPVDDPALQAELDLCLTACLEDATLWQMQPDGRYVKSIDQAVLSAQRHLGAEGSLSKKEDLPLRASVVGVQQALMESYKLERRKHKKKARKATAAVRTRKSAKSMTESMNAFAMTADED